MYKISLFYIYTVARLLIDQCRFCETQLSAWVIRFASPQSRIRKHRNIIKRKLKQFLHSLNQIKNVLLLLSLRCYVWLLKKSPLKSEKLKNSLGSTRDREAATHSVSKWSKVRNRLRVKDQSIRGWKPPTQDTVAERQSRDGSTYSNITVSKVIHNFMDA